MTPNPEEDTPTVQRVDFAGISALSSRPPGYAVALKCLQVQADAEDVDPSLRTDEHVTLHPDAWPWYQGALGEMEVGRILQDLGPGWFIRHSVPIGAGTKDVDHLVIGPGGVFAINTKHHAGASVWVGDHVLRVNNTNTLHLKVARTDALDVGRRLASKVGFPVAVVPVIAVLDARKITDGRSAQNWSIAVPDARRLVTWLRGQPTRLSPTQIELIKLAAEEPGTWHIDPRAADTLRVMQRFERLVSRAGHPTFATAQGTPPRTRPRPANRSTNAVRTAKSGSRTSVASDIVRVWIATSVIIVALLVFRGIADQPCTSPAACIIPSVYLAWKPLLVLGGVAVLGRATWLTLRLLRKAVAAQRRR